MLINKIFIAVLFMLAPLSTWSMHKQNTIITLITGDNKTCTVPSLLAHQLSYIIAGDHYRYLESKASDSFEVPFNKEIIEKLLLCVDDLQYYVRRLTKTELIAVFNAADYLGAPAVILAGIAYRITHELNKDDIPENIQQRIQELPLHLKSLSKLSGEHAIVDPDERRLDLRALDLETIDDLDEILQKRAIDRTHITHLDASYNNIVGVSLRDILKALPQVKHINLSYNKLTEISAADLAALPPGTLLDISNNSITSFDQEAQDSSIVRIVNSGITVDARNNRLSTKRLNALKKILNKPAYYKSLVAKAQGGLSVIQTTLSNRYFLPLSLLVTACLDPELAIYFIGKGIIIFTIPASFIVPGPLFWAIKDRVPLNEIIKYTARYLVRAKKIIFESHESLRQNFLYNSTLYTRYPIASTVWLSILGISLMSRTRLSNSIASYLERIIQIKDNMLIADISNQCPRLTKAQLQKLQKRTHTWLLSKKKQISLSEITVLLHNNINKISF